MRAIILFSFLFSTNAYAQNFKFYLAGKNIEENYFDDITTNRIVNVKLINSTNFKFEIKSVVVIMVMSNSRMGVAGQGSSGAPAPVQIKRVYVENNSPIFSYYPYMQFALGPVLLKYPGIDRISIKVGEIISDTDAGNDWITEHLVLKEVEIKPSITTNPQLGHKGGGN
jgi:hypothetical protein